MPYFAERRRQLATQIGQAVALIPNQHRPQREDDSTRYHGYRYGYEAWRPDSDFLYLTGFTEPESLLVVIGGESPKSILFCQPKDAERELWNGRRLGPEAAIDTLGVDEAWSIAELDQRLPALLQDQRTLCYPFGVDAGWDQRVFRALNTLRGPRSIRSGSVYPVETLDVRTVLHDMRLRKDAQELAHLRQAADITAAAHRRAMRFTRPGQYEYEVEAELLHEFRRRGASAPSYNPIVAGGDNACILHYINNDMPLRDGDLLLIDAGCEVHGYCADVTRTFPVGSRFTGAQRDIYELVLTAQTAGIDCLRPGVPLDRMHQTHVRIISQGLIDLGLLSGSLEQVIETEAYKRYFMHGSGH